MLAAEAGHTAICRLLMIAGADPLLRDHQGLDALALAKAGGFQDVVVLLSPTIPEPTASPVPEQNLSVVDAVPSRIGGALELDRLFKDDEPLDGSAWEAEPEDGPPPEGDELVLQAAVTVQARLSAHVPEDLDEDWSDVGIDLPEIAELRALARRRRQHDDEAILELLRAGLRLGWVHPDWITAVAPRVHGRPDEPDLQYVANLGRTLGDLGVLVDEEVCEPPDLVETVEGAPDLTGDQDSLAREGLSFLLLLNSWRAEPLNYWWQMTRHPVVTREQEVSLAYTMREGRREALSAILLSPAAVQELLGVPARLASGDLALEDVLVPATEEDADPDEEAFDEAGDDDSIPTEDPATLRRHQQQQDLLDALARLGEMHGHRMARSGDCQPILQRMRGILEGLVLAAPFIARLHRIVQSDTLAPEAGRRLAGALNRTDEAKQFMIAANLRLVSWVAKRYAGWSFTDAIQEGCIGLMKAVERFDPHMGCKFSTYGSWWIRQSIGRARGDTERFIRLPIHVLMNYKKLERARDKFFSQTGAIPEIPNLAASLEISPDALLKLLRIPDEPLSLSDPEVAAVEIADTANPDPEEVAIYSNLRRHVRSALDMLEPRQKQIICMRFGLGGYEEQTLEEIGIRFGLTRERIRQIEAKALMRLKHPGRSKHLRSFLE
ncbi:hypothetical protein ROR02_27430 [Pararhodospirillum oryzae]|uniref:RNA polymerase sigma-70 domain-containing protein n=2 Tax=Pararhodospirillum oryzae TaxID=478448 RepID=A0A512HAZ1_9PROT|nr:hypothetical protein ROR02_27430 [Pararhodospirillum oryzae]